MSEAPDSTYDEIAGFYHAHWAEWYLPAALPALEKLFFSRIPHRACVLDVCCGSGHVTQELVRRDYRVTGIDASAQLIALARTDMPAADFRVQDARALQLATQYQAAISTFDSLNHMLSLEDLQSAFKQVHGVLEHGGLFVFDMNLEKAYSADLQQWTVTVGDEEVGLVRGLYDFATKRARTELIWFVRKAAEAHWQQHRSVVEQRCYEQDEIVAALKRAGFAEIETTDALAAGITAELGFGRIFVTARA